MGATVFGESLVAIAPDLTPNEWRSTLAHELVHLARGPVSTERAAVEEHQVQKETARMLVPAGPALAQLDRQWTEQEIQDLAARFAVDRDTVETALRAPIFMPLPRPRSN
ncbi:ImmA/IrrE family metallo-endopeptidase [Pseudonocardia oceani]|uniref:ImmA/IrrE family metallo-endopeptidase n=1 Tax=Pseudonocardia oceani TaxID=2792013 RepID=A0ABS6ULB4_9PSEU|nr:ImmA/IrrE family metallo-endopeptidase [Pseudonocardia oceani]MBW0090518.1 ImmA/IrrE family metallo-endopeptidase [Pseudonocardia oceani]MBW0124369.1 ImmA/IrrE family metallo-endopeptidase [Pseudonocardia oceani]MBW0131234.1 ImmA/IrrE family metallo-endopeptidase [Pseudonocardia oceani]MBW0132599.1 ImmA/IrrE family metallo-endopeptidase [Pseudonocardia oceani]